MTHFLTREEILAMDDLTKEEVFIPEWNASVYVRVMSGAERERFQTLFDAMSKENGSMIGLMPHLCTLTLCDQQAGRLFTLSEAEALAAKSYKAMERIATVALRLNGMQADAVEQAQGNLSGEPSGASGSDSPSPSV